MRSENNAETTRGTKMRVQMPASFKSSTARATSGNTSLHFSVDNMTDAAKVWIERAFVLEPRRRERGGQLDAIRRCLISAVPPCTSSSWRKISAASCAMASAIPRSMRLPLSTVACSGLPYQPASA